MRLRSRRRDLVVWSQSGRYGAQRWARLTRTRRIRQWIRTGVLLVVVGSIRLARTVRPRWRPLLAGAVLTAVGAMLRHGPGGMVLLPGLMCLMSAPLVEVGPQDERTRRSKLERELAAYSTPAQRRDLEATFDRYPDGETHELRDILARQAMATRHTGIPGSGRH
jgi:hypothetical protein